MACENRDTFGETMVINKSLTVKGVEVNLTSRDYEDYISLTDMTKSFNGADQLVKNWL